MASIYRITWPDQTQTDAEDAHDAVAEIKRRWPSAHVSGAPALAEDVNMAAVQPSGHGADWVSIYTDEGCRIEVRLVERGKPFDEPPQGIWDLERMPLYLRALLDSHAETVGEAWREFRLDDGQIREAVRQLQAQVPYIRIDERTPLRGVNDRGIFDLYRRDYRMFRERQLQVEHGLSIQESEVVAAIEAGERVSEIAERLGVTTQAVSKARRNGFAKLRPVD